MSIRALNKHSIFPFRVCCKHGEKTKENGEKTLWQNCLFVYLHLLFVCLFDHWYWTFNDNDVFVEKFLKNFWKFKKKQKQNGIPLYSHTNIVWVDLVCLFFLAVSNIFERSIISWLNGTPPPPKKSLSSSLSMIMMASYASLIGGLFFRCFR